MLIDPIEAVSGEHGHPIVLSMPESLVTRAFSELVDQVVFQVPY